MTQIDIPQEDHDRATRDRHIELRSSTGKPSRWRKESGEWIDWLRKLILLLVLVVGLLVGAHKMATQPILTQMGDMAKSHSNAVSAIEVKIDSMAKKQDVAALADALDRLDRAHWVVPLASDLESERSKLNPTYIPIPRDRIEAIHNDRILRP